MSHEEKLVLNLLLVDDHEEKGDILRESVSSFGINIVQAYSSSEVFSAIAQKEFFAVLIDIQESAFNGFEVAKEIRKNPASKEVPIIFITEPDSSLMSVELGYDLGDVDYIFKPYNSVTLRGKVSLFAHLYQKSFELRQSEIRFRSMVQGVKDYAIFMLDPQGYIQSWNTGAEYFKGYKSEEVIGKHFSIFYTSEDVDRRHPQYELEVAKSGGRYEEEGWRIRKDGSRFWANVLITRVNDSVGGLLGFSKVTRDLTERKKAEEALKKSKLELEQRVLERTMDLEKAIRVRDDFLSIASHELKTPLTSLNLQLSMTKRWFKSGRESAFPFKKFEKFIDVSQAQVRRLQALIDDLLDVSRIEAGKLQFSFEGCDLAQIVADIVDRHRDGLLSTVSEVKLIAKGPVNVQCDLFRLEQAILNLLSNAAKYGSRKPIFVTVESEGGLARISVRDHGIGIPKEKMETIFERFERVSSSENIAGLGLGLYITREIIRGHQGTIRVESEPGIGSTFIFEFPLTVKQS